MRHDYKRLVGRVELADEAEDPGEREHRLHEARKAAKRVRYAAETLTGVYGKPAKKFVKAMKRVQSRLGDHHDAFVTQERLRELGDEAAGTGDNAFVFGVLHAREERALIETDDQFVREWRKASKKKRRRWLSDVSRSRSLRRAQEPPPPALRRCIFGPAPPVTSEPCAFSLTGRVLRHSPVVGLLALERFAHLGLEVLVALVVARLLSSS